MIIVNTNNEMSDALEQQKQAKILGVKHKLYVLALLVVLFMFYPIFSNTLASVRGDTVIEAIQQYPGNMRDAVFKASNGGLMGQIETIQNDTNLQSGNLSKIKDDMKIINFLSNQDNLGPIKNCVEKDNCQGFSDGLKKNLDSLRTFLVLSAYTGTKMNYDQKTLLENIDRYIIRDELGNQGAILEGINFSQPLLSIEKEKIYKVPFVMTLQFENEKQFLACIQRIEKSIYNSAGVVYKIGAMNYDIAKFSQNQKVDMTMYAYFYKE